VWSGSIPGPLSCTFSPAAGSPGIKYPLLFKTFVPAVEMGVVGLGRSAFFVARVTPLFDGRFPPVYELFPRAVNGAFIR